MSSRISRRVFTGILTGLAGFRSAFAQLSGMGSMLWDYTLEYIRLLDERRGKLYDALQTREDLARLRQEVRDKMAAAWGPLPPERTPLNARSVGLIERDDYTIEKVIFESRPDFHVTANVYKPKDAAGKLPAVVVPCGHTDSGKAGETYQRFCILLARNGFIALIHDPVGQGERLQLWNEAKQASAAGPGTREHRVLGQQCYLLGLNLMGYRVWDTSRAIDYLEQRDDVDAARIGMGGNSGGGMETLQYAAFDDRIQAAFPSCAVASFPAKTQALLIADPEQILFQTIRNAVDHTELLAAFAPRPLLIGSAVQDYVPIDAARRTFEDVKRAYRIHDAESKVAMVETDAGHGLNEELRTAAVDWFSRWLSQTSRKVQERPAVLSTEEELRCTETGQVASSLGGKTVLDWNRQRYEEIRPRREVPTNPSEMMIFSAEIQGKVKDVTRVGAFRPEQGIYVADRVLDAGNHSIGTAVVVADLGRDDSQVRRQVIDPIIAAGYRVVALDLRGWGDSKPYLEGREVGFDWDDFFAYRALEIGKPLLGQRMKDLAAVAAGRTRRRSWTVVGVGGGGLVAAHLATIDPRIDRLVTVGAPISYRAILNDPLTKQPFSSFLPGVLGAYDVRELYAATAPRPTLVLNPQDSQGAPVETVKAWEEYDWVARVYETAGATAKFEMKSQLDTPGLRSALTDWFSAR